MKKTLVLLIALLLVISLTSCGQKEPVSSDSNSDNSSQISSLEQENTSSTISKEEEMINRIAESMKLETVNTSVYRNFSEIGRIIDIYIDSDDWSSEICYAINKDGKLYKLSFNKPFISGNNFEEIHSEHKLKKFLPETTMFSLYDLWMIDESGNILTKSSTTDGIGLADAQTYTDSLFMGNKDFTLNMLDTAHIIANNGIALFNWSDDRISFSYVFRSGETIVTLPEDEKIEFVLEGVVKTNKGWHTLKEVQTNKEECEQYAGVEPVYEWQLVKMDFGDDIILAKEISINTYCAVTSDNTVYIVG